MLHILRHLLVNTDLKKMEMLNITKHRPALMLIDCVLCLFKAKDTSDGLTASLQLQKMSLNQVCQEIACCRIKYWRSRCSSIPCLIKERRISIVCTRLKPITSSISMRVAPSAC